MLASFLNGRVCVKVGDITHEDVDAIVNAANRTLLGGGGVDGAIHQAGGSAIVTECKRIRATAYPQGLPAGHAVITTGGELRARYVIHTVGPIYGMEQGSEESLLADCYRNSIQLAATYDLSSIAFPSISTGAFGYPKHEAARIASRAVSDALERCPVIEDVRLVFFSRHDAQMFIENAAF